MPAAFGEAIKPGQAQQVCASLREVLEAGVPRQGAISGSDGVPVAEAVITEADCSAGS